MQHSHMFNMRNNGIWLCFHIQLLKSNLETRIKAYAAYANVQQAENAIWLYFNQQVLNLLLKRK